MNKEQKRKLLNRYQHALYEVDETQAFFDMTCPEGFTYNEWEKVKNKLVGSTLDAINQAIEVELENLEDTSCK